MFSHTEFVLSLANIYFLCIFTFAFPLHMRPLFPRALQVNRLQISARQTLGHLWCCRISGQIDVVTGLLSSLLRRHRCFICHISNHCNFVSGRWIFSGRRGFCLENNAVQTLKHYPAVSASYCDTTWPQGEAIVESSFKCCSMPRLHPFIWPLFVVVKPQEL